MIGWVDVRERGDDLAAVLTELHRRCEPGDHLRVVLPSPDEMDRTTLDDVLEGAGFQLGRRMAGRASRLTRQWTLPDTVGPGMRVLVCGLNPSPAAADAGVGFARPGNRFWPAAMAAGVVTVDRDPDHALVSHGLGMTDVVKRTTPRADELDPSEYVAGFARLERLAARLRPEALCFVGLAGWRTARDRKATTGWQDASLGGAPVYLMPSTSGLNASSQMPDFVEHFRAVVAGPPA
jgi:TDG/mug DNA glycosylase family protein